MSNLITNLTNGGGRVKVHDAQMVTKLPKAAKELVKNIADGRGLHEADIVREALAEYFERRGYAN